MLIAEVDWALLQRLWHKVKKNVGAGEYTVTDDLDLMYRILTETFNRRNTINMYTLEDWLRLYESMMEVNVKMFDAYHRGAVPKDVFLALLEVRDAFEGKNGILVRVEKALKISPDDSASGAHMRATGAGTTLVKSPVLRRYLAAHSTSDPGLYPNALVQRGKDPVEIRIKRLDCSKPHHINRYFGYLRSFAERLDKVKYAPWLYVNDSGNFCHALSAGTTMLQDQHPNGANGIRPKNVFHYVAYIPQSMDILGWMICEEYSVEDNSGVENTFVFMAYIQTVGQFGKYKGIGGAMMSRLAAYCKARGIHFFMFYTGTKTLMKKGQKRAEAKHMGRDAGLFTHSFVEGYPTMSLIKSMRLY